MLTCFGNHGASISDLPLNAAFLGLLRWVFVVKFIQIRRSDGRQTSPVIGEIGADNLGIHIANAHGISGLKGGVYHGSLCGIRTVLYAAHGRQDAGRHVIRAPGAFHLQSASGGVANGVHMVGVHHQIYSGDGRHLRANIHVLRSRANVDFIRGGSLLGNITKPQ